MWQLKKLSTDEALSEPGPLPVNWGPIFGLEGIKDKLGDLSWLGSAYSDTGWVELNAEEQKAIVLAPTLDRIEKEKTIANNALANDNLTLEEKILWDDYLLALDKVTLQPDLEKEPMFPIRPDV